jgi:hypothetical protein
MLNMFTAWLVGAALLLSLGCAAKQLRLLEQDKKAHAAGNFEEVCQQTVDCKEEPETCAQRYFLKADACYALAKDDDQRYDQLTSQERILLTESYGGAADNFAQGFATASSWPLKGLQRPGRTKLYENWCDSLRFLFDENPSKKIMARYLAAAHRFHSDEPDAIGAIFWYAKARYTSLGPLMHGTANPSNLGVLCRELSQIEQDLNVAEDRALSDMRYQSIYRELKEQVEKQLKLSGCQK